MTRMTRGEAILLIFVVVLIVWTSIDLIELYGGK
jgi:hypothetical protein